MKSLHSKLPTGLLPLLAAAVLTAACSDSTAPVQGVDREVAAAAAHPESAAAATSSATPQLTIPSGYVACRVIQFTSSGDRTYTGTVYKRDARVATQYYVKVKNYNILGWYGTIILNRYPYSRFLLPYASTTLVSGAFLGVTTRAMPYTITVSPNSDASALGLTIYAPRCS